MFSSTTPDPITGPGFVVNQAAVGALDNNAYLVRCTGTNQALLVDAADDIDALVELAADADVVAIVTTHGHWDHHQAAQEVGRHLGAPVLLHPADLTIAAKPFSPLATGPLSFGEVTAQIIHTPGHTPGSICVVLDGVVLTGDTLFPGGPGATRFEYSSFDTIIASIRDHLFILDDSTIVLPGHGAGTTIGTERDQLPVWIERGW
ncbi:MAG: MBL fold metallo-hydrolase [Acidimicrobiia bacterium]